MNNLAIEETPIVEETVAPATEPNKPFSINEIYGNTNAVTTALMHELETAKLPVALLKMRAQLNTLTKQAIQNRRDLMNTCNELRALETTMDKYMLHLAKKENKTHVKRPSGFATPIPMVPELAEFMGVEVKGMISRTDATKVINKYIETRKLQCAHNKRTFIPDGAIMKLLHITTPEPMAYFDIQRKLNIYFNPKPPAMNSQFGMDSDAVMELA